MKILLIEDNEIDAFIAQQVLKDCEGETRFDVVESGVRAIELITTQYLQARELPDVILVDMYMPVMNGLEFLEAYAGIDIKEKDRIQVIMLTNSIDPHLHAEAIRLGARGILTKPVSAGMLAALAPADPAMRQG
jgi:CheY-like chemotaxis protein